MESKQAKIVLKEFFEGQTTIEEEKQLSHYFLSADVPLELEVYKELFMANNELSSIKFDGFEEEIIKFVSQPKSVKKYPWLWPATIAIAASMILAILIINHSSENTRWQDTYNNREQAHAEATKTIRYVAELYQKGLAQLEPLRKIERASQPVKRSLVLVHRGFKELDKMKTINQKAKN